MIAFLSNEPEPTAGSWFRLYVTCRRRGDSQPDKIGGDKASHWWLDAVTPSLFFGGKTGLVSSILCLNYSFGFTIYDLLHSSVQWCNYLWKPDQENDPGETSPFPTPLPLLEKVQKVLALEWLMRRETNRCELETEPLFLEPASPTHQGIIKLHPFWTNLSQQMKS